MRKAPALFNPFPAFLFTGTLRPVYPLSPRREVPESIPHPDYAKDGIPKSERKFVGRNNITILNKSQQDAMRKVCRLAREVLDIAAKAIKPGVTTDYLDEIVHKACLEREVGSVRANQRLCLWAFINSLTSLGLSFAFKLCPFPEINMYITERSHLSWDTRPAHTT